MTTGCLKPIMFVGTGSDAGKSLINAGFCRVFIQDGYTPAPFKAQNMSLNSFATPEGLEIGRAQAAQAEACSTPCHVNMNPVLLKPTGEQSSQVVLLGKPVGDQTAHDYFMGNHRQGLFEAAKQSFRELEKEFNPIVMEGAGSISELNLKKRDITNMRMALAAGADVYLVADIDRGGVFGSVYGTIHLLDEKEREAIKGIIINKFRGDLRLFEEGKQIIEEITGKPVVGVLPYLPDVYVEEEDSVSLAGKSATSIEGKINVAVVRLNQLSNFTDFNALAMHPDIHLYYTLEKDEFQKADIIILPGSKNTISDLQMLMDNGIDKIIHSALANGKKVIGICGGYQMMGDKITDTHGVEGTPREITGLGMLPVTTTLAKEKTTIQTSFYFMDYKEECEGYEIHMGQTECTSLETNPVCVTNEGKTDGCMINANCWGTYMHGIMDNTQVINHLLEDLGAQNTNFNYKGFKNENFDRLADHLRKHMDMDYIYESLKK